MPSVTIDNTAKSLPADEFQAQKVANYNSVFAGLEAAWTTWVPTWTNLTLSNGQQACAYRQIGKLIVCRVAVLFGSSTSISGAVSLSLPVNRSNNYGGTAGITALGQARFFDSSGGIANEGAVMNVSTTTVRLQVFDASASYLKSADLASNVPFSWAVNDEITAQFVYEVA